MQAKQISRRQFLAAASAVGVSAAVLPLRPARADMIPIPGTSDTGANAWYGKAGLRYRRDGLAKVTGSKVFATDLRGRDMQGWPDGQSYALIFMIPRADRIWTGLDLSILQDMAPDVLIDAETIARDGIAMPEPDFYGQFFLEKGKVSPMLGQPVAMGIWHDYERFRAAKQAVQFNDDIWQWGDAATPPERAPYGAARYVRVGGDDPRGEDVFSPMKNTVVWPDLDVSGVKWPGTDNPAFGEAMRWSDKIRQQMQTPPEGVQVYSRRFQTQFIDHVTMETENGLAYYDADAGRLEVVGATQSPYACAHHILDFVAESRLHFKHFQFWSGYTVGYGQKEHQPFPYYVALAALYAQGRPVRVALDRWQQFQFALKRHPFQIDTAIAVDQDGQFQAMTCDMIGNGGGVINFSPSVGTVGATAAQSIYYFPKSDLSAQMNPSIDVTAGSMRGYGTLQSMSTTEILVDEIADDLGMDAIALRQKNVMKTGMKNTQGAVPSGDLRIGEILDIAAQDPLWTQRAARKAEYEAQHPGMLYGVGFGAVQKDFGTGAEAAIVSIEITPEGRLQMSHIGAEIGCGSTTAQAIVARDLLGRAIDDVRFSVQDWPQMPLHTKDQPYTTSQEDEDMLAQDPYWVPRFTSPRSASNSAYYFSHTTREAARLLLRLSLWPAALSLWGAGKTDSQMLAQPVRLDQAEWVDGRLVAGGLAPLSLEALAKHAHENGLITGVCVHSFNRWQWAEADFTVDGDSFRAQIDALSVRRPGGGQTNAPAPAQETPGDKASANARDRSPDPGPVGGAGLADVQFTSGGSVRNGDGWTFQPRRKVYYPPVQRNNAGTVYYAPCATMVELAVSPASGEVRLLSHKTWLECGNMIVPELVSGQIQGGLAMGIGHALYEELPAGPDGPGNGQWGLSRYQVPRAADVAVWTQTGHVLPPLSESDPPKGMAEVVMIPVVAACANAITHATGHRFYDFPISAARIKEALS